MIQDHLSVYEQWKTDNYFDEATRMELIALNPETDMKEIQDRFYKDLEVRGGGCAASWVPVQTV